jgi:hypothetical protein
LARSPPTNTVANNNVTATVVTGGTLIFTDTVTGVDGIAPTGAISWTVSGPDGLSACVEGSPETSGDVVTETCTIANAQAGAYSATASQAADSNYALSTSSPDLTTVGTVTPTNTVANNNVTATVVTGGTLIFTDTVTGVDGIAPTGAISWTVSGPRRP